jgi:UPF0716 protein FxsA
MPVLLILVILPLIEIGLFVVIGGLIGVWGVLALVILGALVGVALLRGRLARIPALLRTGDDPARLLAQGAMTAMGAVLLIAPGFLTDIIGLTLLLPPVQRAVARRFAHAVPQHRHETTVIDGEFVVHEPPSANPPTDPPHRLRPPSGH